MQRGLLLKSKVFVITLVVLFCLSTTFLLNFLEYEKKYSEQTSKSGRAERTIKANSFNFHSIEIGAFPKSEKTLVATNLSNNSKYIYVSSRTRNVIKQYNFSSNRSIDYVGTKNLSHQATLSHSVNGIRKSNFFIYDLVANNDFLYVSTVETYHSENSCDRISILKFRINPLSGALGKEQIAWRYGGCIRYGNGEPDGNLSLRLATAGKSVLMTVGLVSALPFTNVYPNPGLIGLPPTFEESLKKFSILGSVIEIQPNGSSLFKIIAKGLRSPQGIVADFNNPGTVWVTDHGPRGGDELNEFRGSEFPNFGWPYVTLGIPYFSERDEKSGSTLKVNFGSHFGYKSPRFFWTPSIAPSQLVLLNNSMGPKWSNWNRGDILVSTLKSESLFKLTRDSYGNFISEEKVFLGERIRDIDQLGGLLVLGTDSGKIMVLEPSSTFISEGLFPPLQVPYTEPQYFNIWSFLKLRWQQVLSGVDSIF